MGTLGEERLHTVVTLQWLRGLRMTLVIALLLSVGTLMGASAVHSHDGDPAQCLVCRWAQETVPVLVTAFVLLLSLPDAGRTATLAPACRPLLRARRSRSRAPPLV